MTPQDQWTELSMQVDEAVQDHVLIEGVGPFLHKEMQSGLVTRGYFLREGQGTQRRLRLRLAADPMQSHTLKEQFIQMVFQRGLQDTIFKITADPEADFNYYEILFEGTSARALLEDFFSETNAFLLDVLSTLHGDEIARLNVAFDLMVAFSIALSKHLLESNAQAALNSSFFAYSIHTEGFLAISREPQAIKLAFEQRYKNNADSWQQRFQQLQRQFEGGNVIVSPLAHQWATYIDIFVERIKDALSSGTLHIKADTGDQVPISSNSFYEAMKGRFAFQAYTPGGTQFPMMRSLFSYLFWTLGRLGVHLSSRYFLCYAISRTFEMVYTEEATSDGSPQFLINPTPMPDHWTQMRVYAHETVHDHILTKGIAPFLEKVIQQDLVSKGFFLREGLPGRMYLNLYLDNNPIHKDRLFSMLNENLQQENLSKDVVQVKDEPGKGFLESLSAFRGSAARPLIEAFFCDTTTFLFKLISEIEEDETVRLQISFDLMVAQAIAINNNIFRRAQARPYPTSFLSYRSHADGFFIMSKNPQKVKEVFETRYLTASNYMRNRLGQLLLQFDRTGPVISQDAETWHSFINSYIQRILAEIVAGRLEMIQDQDGYLGDQNDISISPLHQTIQHNPLYQEFMKTDVEFLAMRIMHSYLYWTLHRLGLRLIERYFLCNAVSRSFEEFFQVDPIEAITSIAQTVFTTGASRHTTSVNPSPTII